MGKSMKEENSCANCIHSSFEEETDHLVCDNALQIHKYISETDYCFYHVIDTKDES